MLLSCEGIGGALVVAIIAWVFVSFTKQTTTNNGRTSFFILQENWGMTRKFSLSVELSYLFFIEAGLLNCFNCNQFRPEPSILTRRYKEAGSLRLIQGSSWIWRSRKATVGSSPASFFSPAKDALKRRVT